MRQREGRPSACSLGGGCVCVCVGGARLVVVLIHRHPSSSSEGEPPIRGIEMGQRGGGCGVRPSPYRWEPPPCSRLMISIAPLVSGEGGGGDDSGRAESGDKVRVVVVEGRKGVKGQRALMQMAHHLDHPVSRPHARRGA